MEDAAKQVYLYAAGSKDPKARAAAQRLQREREQSDDVGKLRRELEELKSARATEQQETSRRQVVEQFTEALVTAAKGEAKEAAPVVNKLLAKNPAKTREKLFAIADELGRALGAPPEYGDVIAEMEKRERADLEDRGVDLGVYLGVYLGATAAPPAKPSKTLGRAGGGGKTAPVAQSDDDLAREVAREIAEGRHLAG